MLYGMDKRYLRCRHRLDLPRGQAQETRTHKTEARRGDSEARAKFGRRNSAREPEAAQLGHGLEAMEINPTIGLTKRCSRPRAVFSPVLLGMARF